jgi:mannose-6-phosphate isomerase-like protein (cupin superfamily)/predicted N-acetyltransferase YhbS
MMPITMRPMSAADLDEVTRLGIASKASWRYNEQAMRIFAEELRLDRSRLDSLLDAQVACEDGRIVGYFTIQGHADGVAELHQLFVRPDRFRQGIGSQLLQAACASATKHGVERLKILADPHASGFYEKSGATYTGDHQSSIPGRTIPIYELAIERRISLPEKFALIREHWRPKVAARLNGQELKLVKFEGEFPWHHHEEADEMFLVWRGSMTIEFRDRRVNLQQGEFCVVPRGVEHRTMADEEAEVLVFEPAGTRNTGNIVDDTFTAPDGVSI